MTDYMMGKHPGFSRKIKEPQQLTFVVTQACNLACKYCYMVAKNNKQVMSLPVAKKAVDFFLSSSESPLDGETLILDFIGNEPFLEIELIDQIVDYFKIRAYQLDSKWFSNYIISFSSNGLLYSNDKVQRFLDKNKGHVSVGISIDGDKPKHDLQRVYPDGKGSYDDVIDNVRLLLQQNPNAVTKVTIGHEDLPLIKDSLIHLQSLGYKEIAANVVFEDVWRQGDDQIFEDQLIKLADYIIDNNIWDKCLITLFSDQIGYKLDHEQLEKSVCGTGRMFAVDAGGDIYSCVRFMSYSLNGKEARSIGNIETGINMDHYRAFRTIIPKYVLPQVCLDCNVNSECMYCTGQNYDVAEVDTLYRRSTAICDMHKARVRANRYYWARLWNEHGIKRISNLQNDRFLYILLSNQSVDYCGHRSIGNDQAHEVFMPDDSIIHALSYAFENFYTPVLVHSEQSIAYLDEHMKASEPLRRAMKRHIIRSILPLCAGRCVENGIYVVEQNQFHLLEHIAEKYPAINLNIDADQLALLYDSIVCLYKHTDRINLNIRGLSISDLSLYSSELEKVKDYLAVNGMTPTVKELNRLTDRIFLKEMDNCFAGEKNLTIAPDGRLYICPLFYHSGEAALLTSSSDYAATYGIPQIDTAVLSLTKKKASPFCDNCDAFHCERCVYDNHRKTRELNVPSAVQCKAAHIERELSKQLLTEYQRRNGGGMFSAYQIGTITYDDPGEPLFHKPVEQPSPVC
jgi:radical SAM peptide maturase (CXXX-repeat target family)/CXXX repeat peptide maturase